MSALEKVKKSLGWVRKHKLATATSVTGIILLPFSGVLAGLALGVGGSWELLKYSIFKDEAKKHGYKSLKEYKKNCLKDD